MTGLPWVRFFPSDWLAGTRGLTALESGVYISLVAMMYERKEPLTEEPKRLARLCGATNPQFHRALEVLIEQGKIVRTEAGLWNNRVDDELGEASKKSSLGREAANARWHKTSNENNKRAMPGHPDGNANHNHKETAKAVSNSTPRDELLHVLDEEHAAAIIEHRQRLRKPLTPRAGKMLATQLAKAENPNDAADMMLQRGWIGFDVEWTKGNRNGRHGQTANGPSLAEIYRRASAIADDDAIDFYAERPGEGAQSH